MQQLTHFWVKKTWLDKPAQVKINTFSKSVWTSWTLWTFWTLGTLWTILTIWNDDKKAVVDWKWMEMAEIWHGLCSVGPCCFIRNYFTTFSFSQVWCFLSSFCCHDDHYTTRLPVSKTFWVQQEFGKKIPCNIFFLLLTIC